MKQRFLVLDSFRGLFAVSIVIFHLNVVGSITDTDFFRGSSVFVDFFFVLSGFVIAHSYAYNKKLSFKRFAISRTFRLFPLHIFMLAIFIFLECCKYAAFKYGGFSFNVEPFTEAGAVSQIIPNLLLIHSWTKFTTALTFNYPSWSISIEYYVYMIFFMTLVGFKRFKILGWFAISLLMFYLMTINTDFPVDKVKQGLSCFFAGGVTYAVYRNFKHIKLPYVLSTAVEFTFLIFVVYVVSSEFANKILISSILFCFTIYIFAYEQGLLSRVLKGRYFTRLGELSYSIYMTHAAILFMLISTAMVLQKITGKPLAPMVDGDRAITTGNILMNDVLVLVVILIVIGVSILTNKYIEKVGQRLGKRLSSNLEYRAGVADSDQQTGNQGSERS